MPKLTDHDERRRAIIEATWRQLAERGIEGANLRDIATAAGYAKPSAILYYFGSKQAILSAAYEYVYTATNQRIYTRMAQEANHDGIDPIRAVRIMCEEILPLEQTTQQEARIAIVFWQASLTDEQLARIGVEAIEAWVRKLAGYFRSAIEGGVIGAAEDPELLAEELINLMTGLVITTGIDRIDHDEVYQRKVMSRFFARLGLTW